jgi:hypothetical protein
MRRHRLDAGALIFGALLVFVGGYYLLRNTLGVGLPELDGEKVWPVVVLALGIVVVVNGMTRRRDATEERPR